MTAEVTKEEIVEESTAESTGWKKIDILFLLVAVNFVLELIVTVVALFVKEEYLDQLIKMGVAGILGFVVVICIMIVLAMIYYVYAARLRKWDDEKAADKTLNFLYITGVIFTLITITILYFAGSSFFPLVLDPFDLNAISSVLGIIFSVWWFFGFTISVIILAILLLIILVAVN